MGRVPKKKSVEYTEAVDVGEGNDADDAGVEDSSKYDNNNKNTEAELSDSDGFESLRQDTSAEETAAEECAENPVGKVKRSDGDSDDEPLCSKKRKGSPQKARGTNGKRAGKQKKIVPEKWSEEEYEVKEVLGHKVEGGKDLYLIRWKGYTKNDDTWEPAHTLSCPELIEKFNKTEQASTSKSKKPLSAVAAKKSRPAIAAKNKSSEEKGGNRKDDPNKQWEVEKIVDYAEEKGGRIFRIRWKGYAPKHDTWEPEKHLNCDEIIKKFLSRMKSLEHLSSKELRQDTKKPRRLYNETAPITNMHNAIGRKSKRANTKTRPYYGDSD